MSAYRYSMLIQWSDEDQAFLVTLPEWKDRVLGPVTHGDTYEEALEHGQEAIANLREATELYLEETPLPFLDRPLLTTFEVASA